MSQCSIIYPFLTEAFECILYSFPLYLEKSGKSVIFKFYKCGIFKVQRGGVKNIVKSLSEKWIDNSLYGKAFVIYNVHSLVLLADDCMNYGRVDNFSAFVYKNYMQFLKKILSYMSKRIQKSQGKNELNISWWNNSWKFSELCSKSYTDSQSHDKISRAQRSRRGILTCAFSDHCSQWGKGTRNFRSVVKNLNEKHKCKL